MTEQEKPPLLKGNPYPDAHKNHKNDKGCFQCGVHLGYEEGKQAQREADIKWMKENCYLKAKEESPFVSMHLQLSAVRKTVELMLKEVDGVAHRAVKEFKD